MRELERLFSIFLRNRNTLILKEIQNKPKTGTLQTKEFSIFRFSNDTKKDWCDVYDLSF